jgi:hypothetical protein
MEIDLILKIILFFIIGIQNIYNNNHNYKILIKRL